MSLEVRLQALKKYNVPEAPKVTGGSPQSILGGIGSWSCRLTNSSNHSPLQGLSTPATPYEAKDETLELIYAATGQVARLKRNGEDAALNGDWRAVSKPKQNQTKSISSKIRT
ncbi:unnamed protein product [Rhodiola kirilowii]